MMYVCLKTSTPDPGAWSRARPFIAAEEGCREPLNCTALCATLPSARMHQLLLTAVLAAAWDTVAVITVSVQT